MARDLQPRIELGQRLQREAALVQPRMRDAQARLDNRLVSVEKQIEVDGARAEAGPLAPDPPEAALDREQALKQLACGEGGAKLDRAVQETWLVRVADRVGLTQARHRDDVDTFVRREQLERVLDLPARVAQVRAEPDEGSLRAVTRCRLAQILGPDGQPRRRPRRRPRCRPRKIELRFDFVPGKGWAVSLAFAALALAAASADARVDSTTLRAPRAKSPVTIRRVAVQGRVAKLTVRTRRWAGGARLRVFVDGRYNNFSTIRTLVLALDLPPGKHRVTADVVLGRRALRRSAPRTIRVAPIRGTVLAAAGDIACDPADPSFNGGRGTGTNCRAAATARLIAGARPSLVLALGDEQYECGSASAFAQSYGLSWGRFNRIVRPVPGNHEYASESVVRPDCPALPPGAGYFSYFGSVAHGPGGYYSFDIGSWHLIALNSECAYIGGCGSGSPEEQWLRRDLAAHRTQCTLAYWHRPRWTGAAVGDGDASFDAFWRDLSAAGTDLVLNGHRHLYIRLTPLGPTGLPDRAGIREIIVGTGGVNLFGQPFAGIVESHEQTEYGALRLTLRAGSYEWQFEPEQGGTFTDYGTARCH